MGVLSRKMPCLAAAGGLLAGCAVTVSGPADPAAEAVTAAEADFLRGLHHNAVEIFVDRPGFGMRRLQMNLHDLLTGPKSSADVTAASPQTGRETPAPKAGARPAHYAVQDLLIERAGRFPTADGREAWQLRTFHLVGLVKHAEPVVYLAEKNPGTGDEAATAAADIPTRGPDAFETAAVAAVRGGEPLTAEKAGNRLRLFAPVFAGNRCAACHDPGTLLGGFSYELERVAHDAAKDGVRPPRGR